MASINIMKEVRDALERWKGYWPAIAEEAAVDHNTVALVGRGKRSNPTVNTAQQILDVIDRLENDMEYRDRVLFPKLPRHHES